MKFNRLVRKYKLAKIFLNCHIYLHLAFVDKCININSYLCVCIYDNQISLLLNIDITTVTLIIK